ncbi:MAG: hypothetical protein U5L11_06725 [Arhodomonas sp.]|nr:hypothetical protein [Arhodomonas sp.]
MSRGLLRRHRGPGRGREDRRDGRRRGLAESPGYRAADDPRDPGGTPLGEAVRGLLLDHACWRP